MGKNLLSMKRHSSSIARVAVFLDMNKIHISVSYLVKQKNLHYIFIFTIRWYGGAI